MQQVRPATLAGLALFFVRNMEIIVRTVEDAAALGDLFWARRDEVGVGGTVADSLGDSWVYVGFVRLGRFVWYILLEGSSLPPGCVVKYRRGSAIRSLRLDGTACLIVECEPLPKGGLRRAARWATAEDLDALA